MSIFLHYGDIKTIIKRCPVTSLLILVNSFFLLITIISGGIVEGFKFGNLVRLGGLVPSYVFAGEYYRLFITMFLHGSVIHYLFNTFFGLLILGAGLEKLIGSIKFLIIYLFSGLVSSLFVLVFSYSEDLTIGASGAVFGVLGAFLFIILFKKNLLSFSDRTYIRNLLIVNLIFTFVTPFISKSGHLGGLITGFILGFVLLINKNNYYY
ncbi:rhomboid family intramembrane serine protease [Mycoplasmatota bacterium]|nr:rhomboid family intramembrane serine protease [Mycoplasmatota bacterium]